MNIFIETYGCESNIYTTGVIAAILTQKGHILTQKDKADLIIMNTCALETKTEKKILQHLNDIHGDSKKILVAGCLTELMKEKIKEIAPKASIMGTSSIPNIAEVVDKISENFKVTRLKDRPQLLAGMPHMRIYPAIASIQIAEGCLDNCSYCIDRLTRGTLISYEPDEIIREAMNAINEKCSELQLITQDVASYGKDKGLKLPGLLRKLSSIPGNFKVRLGAMNPANVLPILDDLILAYNHPKVYQYLDLPLQSGSNRILKDMKRNYTREEYMMIVSAFRKKYPHITISTDVMLGYPGETDEDFGKTIDLIKEIRPDMINVYHYSQRPYTKAGAPTAPSWKVKNWEIELDQLMDKIKDKKKGEWSNWAGEATVTQRVGNKYLARNFTYKPILLERATLGETRKVEITGEESEYLIGR